MSKVYDSIKAIRVSKSLKQEEVAQKLGMAQSNYARMEKGLTQITVDRLEQLAEVFEMSVAAILSYETGEALDNGDVSYYIELCRKYEKQIETYKKRIEEAEQEETEFWSKTNDELKAAKEKLKHLIERIKEKDRTIQILEKAIDALSKS